MVATKRYTSSALNHYTGTHLRKKCNGLHAGMSLIFLAAIWLGPQNSVVRPISGPRILSKLTRPFSPFRGWGMGMRLVTTTLLSIEKHLGLTLKVTHKGYHVKSMEIKINVTSYITVYYSTDVCKVLCSCVLCPFVCRPVLPHPQDWIFPAYDA